MTCLGDRDLGRGSMHAFPIAVKFLAKRIDCVVFPPGLNSEFCAVKADRNCIYGQHFNVSLNTTSLVIVSSCSIAIVKPGFYSITRKIVHFTIVVITISYYLFSFCSTVLINFFYLSTSENGVLKIFHLVISRFDILV